MSLPRWADLSTAEQDIMRLACEQSPLWEVTAGSVDLVEPPVVHPALGLDHARETLTQLMRPGLIRLCWDDERAQDLTPAEVTTVLNDPSWWARPPTHDPSPALYLTPLGGSVLGL